MRPGIGDSGLGFARWLFAASAVVCALTISAHGQLTWVVNLSPAGAQDSRVYGLGGWEVGAVDGRASTWEGSAESWVDLSPAGASDSSARGIWFNQQVGNAQLAGESNPHAILWSGTADSWVDLNPVGAIASSACGVYCGQQVGVATVDGHDHASLWTDTAESWVDLSPPGSVSSDAMGVCDGRQVGYTVFPGDQPAHHAVLWSGSAASWVDLHPIGATGSVAYAIFEGQQVGMAEVGSWHASLWNGSAASWVDLNPAGADASVAKGVYDGRQVGWAYVDGHEHASLWSGTAESWVDLSAFLPAGRYSASFAEGTMGDEFNGCIVGYGVTAETGSFEALMWRRECTLGEGDCANGMDDDCDGNTDCDDTECARARQCEGSCCVGTECTITFRSECPGQWTQGGWCDPSPCQSGPSEPGDGGETRWHVVRLSPADGYYAEAYGVSGGQQVGSAGGVAALWNGSAGSWVDLTPAWACSSSARGVSDGQQVGSADGHAGLWTGSADSWVDLHPAGTMASSVWGVQGGQQVGGVMRNYLDHASLWTGTAASWVDLHPPGAVTSDAMGVYDGQQVGYASFLSDPANFHAILWSGTADSWVDLSPDIGPAGLASSVAYAIHDGQQVGMVIAGNWHASLWTGSAASWVDLNPAGAASSGAEGVYGERQVGWALVDGDEHASLWSGTAASWVDLSLFLPPGRYWDSFAKGIWDDGTNVYVVGYGITAHSEFHEALMWIGPCTPRETDCTDGIDNDSDGYTDCDDADCASSPSCQGSCCVETTCTITLQADCDGQWTQGGSCDPYPCQPQPADSQNLRRNDGGGAGDLVDDGSTGPRNRLCGACGAGYAEVTSLMLLGWFATRLAGRRSGGRG